MTREEVVQKYESGERNFEGVDLSWANLKGANLQGAILNLADLYRANLEGAVIYLGNRIFTL